MPQVDALPNIKPIEKYLVVRKAGNSLELLCETSNFNSAASFHLKQSGVRQGVYLLKNIEYVFTAKEAGR